MFEYHSEKIKDCFKNLKTSEQGLNKDEVEKRLKKYGFNELPEEKKVSKIVIFLSQFNNALAYILLVAGTLSFLLQEYVDSGVIFAAVILNSIIGYIQENKANQAISKLKSLVEHNAYVLRDGNEILISSKFITKGDVIFLKAGDRVPADARLMETNDLRVDEASLTGESFPVNKKFDQIYKKGVALADRKNIVYAGTVISHGTGKAVVTFIGINTEIGKIAQMVKTVEEEATPLQIRLAKFSKFLGIIATVICAFIIIIGVSQDRAFFEMFEIGVAIAVAAIPEGLTIAVTFILALGMQQILKKKALTKKLVAAETLGSITVICTDKTGTLTEGKMHVDHIVIGENEFEVGSLGSRQDKEEAKIVSLALQTAMMCNDASVENPDDALASWKFLGSSTETALLKAAIQSVLRKKELLKNEIFIGSVPFDSEKKYMISLHEKINAPEDKTNTIKYVLYEKGAPERLLEKSNKFFHKGKINLITKEEKIQLYKTYEKLTSKGLRVIGLAMRDLSIPKEEKFQKDKIDWRELDQKLVFIGFIAIKDPLRPTSVETIQTCRKAGIRPVIITGDHQLTAKAIALELGLKVENDHMITGDKLDEISDEDLKKLVKKIDVYARVSPHHKLRIVRALQACGEVVAMTGDGVNDSPALKTADIGIALGTGTDIAKETADIVLLDDNFSTIVAAVRQGRVIFKNIRKVVTYLVSDSFSEMILIVGSIVLAIFLGAENVPLAILPAQILWINIINDGLPDFSLAFEHGDDSIMEEKPLKKDEPLLNNEMKVIIFGVAVIRDFLLLGIFVYLVVEGFDSKFIQTFLFATLGVKSLLSVFSIRNLNKPIWTLNPFSNKYLIGAVFVSMSLLIVGVYAGPFQVILKTCSLSINSWFAIFAFSIFSIFMMEMVKLYYNRVHIYAKKEK